MDVFKLAFDTIVVGLLGFVWLGLAAYFLSPERSNKFLAWIVHANKEEQTLITASLLTLAYCLGSAMLPISSQLVNDEHWPLSESAIRCLVFKKQQARLDGIRYRSPENSPLEDLKSVRCGAFWAPHHHVDPDKEKVQQLRLDKLLTLFQQQEIAVLNQGGDKTERIRQLHERIVVLRGAVFSGLALSLLCLFAYLSRLRGHPARGAKTVSGVLLAGGLTIFVLWNGVDDLLKSDIFDIPVLESLLGALTIFGLVLVVMGVKTWSFVRMRILVVIGFLAALAYGGWMSSEISYDQQIMNSFAVAEKQAGQL